MEISLPLIIGALVGLTAGYIGSFMVLRRMALTGDALSHVALPGLALGLLFGINPFIGAFAALFIGIVLIWLIENKTQLPTETLVGIIFTVSLAIGLLITPQTELLEALFGNIAKLTTLDALIAGGLSVFCLILTYSLSRQIILGTISDDLARSVGIKTRWIDFLFLLLVALVVAIGIKVVGTLLMGALVIIPAAAAKNISHSFGRYGLLAGGFGLLGAVGGIYFANLWHLSPGPLVVLASALIFVISLFFRRS